MVFSKQSRQPNAPTGMNRGDIMDLQKFIDNMNESQAKERSNYHLTIGGLIDALEKAPANATVDEKFNGIGSWRGSYIEVAIFTEDNGLHAEKSEFDDYGSDNFHEKYEAWEKENVVSYEKLSRNANELAEQLKEILGLYFVGYKGGHFKIEDYKPLWLTTDGSFSGNTAIIGIDENLKFITKELED